MRVPAFLLRDFERLFNGGYDEHGNYDAGTCVCGRHGHSGQWRSADGGMR